jgi:hypothetical protein
MTAAERRDTLVKAKDLLQQALAVAKPADPAYQARLQLAYAQFELGEFYDAALLAEFEAKEHPKGPAASEAVTLALASYGKAFEPSLGEPRSRR